MTETLNAPTTNHHAKRIEIYDVAPELYAGMMSFSNAAARELDPTIGELIKIRASQINHCAFCLDMHVHDARRLGETEQRLALVAAWEEAGDLFTDRERAALALTEAITDLSHGPVPDDVYLQAAAVFTKTELAHVIGMATVINSWNRLNAATRKSVPRRR
ncbi:carboxymuconolactone decarboxylase family protein [Mycobacterium sp. CBMA293]|uniref:carboxymuconolactone decarboxylase family protein n=1 Tax=unclassified Mycolicibacterium TaxID=2636767 RepID=UPI0012DD6794|nr:MULTISPECIES: carboxymuconolactone decarboxylase family protein [unclassified Mycolicibacterium]MUL46604.1 carboxymuconolactone decarboxylase family protein [Mycolicibacterium sp. CBMA 360]MUL59097.1 carboxymuconolactone decarboxylase family protein [Mycolicibacterium sp. CBMA 335]MUL69491.1 carboxymuconolactone decarboxylase family protein [Mycolicibacterium sp. CBMA 311]MUL94455.1 carboxymuconolactone decarboxylase family protein [Mycolicibacterium sp. CBMA 230]MUM06528.1 4-carboxymuconol